jgi:hypothetical protein
LSTKACFAGGRKHFTTGLITLEEEPCFGDLQHTLCKDIEEDDVKLSERGHRVNLFPQDGGEESEWSTSTPLLRSTQNRNLISTLRHFMGLVPDLTELEDKICISGASVPLVLMEIEDDLVLVDEAYLWKGRQ